VVLYDHEPIGMVQWERFGDDPAFMATYAVDEPEAVNCDVLIGAPGFAHRGLGPELIRQFLTTLAMADERAPYCVIDPEVENAIAIRAYAKLGFTHVRTCDDGWGAQVYLMQASREVIFGLEALDWRAAAGSRAP
jgi:aminoglycoside 6'-N-acetyltransferase